MFNLVERDHYDLLNLVFKNNGQIVGGYVREWVRENGPPKRGWADIDLRFENNFFLQDFRRDLIKNQALFNKFDSIIDYRYTIANLYHKYNRLDKNLISTQDFLNDVVYLQAKIFYSANHFYLDKSLIPKIKNDAVYKLYLYDISFEPEKWEKFAKDKIVIYLYDSLEIRNRDHEQFLIKNGWRLKIKDHIFDKSNYYDSFDLKD